jgi:RimJ/RimL family protein N-acetyltransferase
MFPTLEGPRVRLRAFAERDLAEFARYRALPEVARYQSWEQHTLEDAEQLYAKQQGSVYGAPGSWHQVAIADQLSDALIGDCALHFLDGDKELEIGFTLAPDRQGKGLAREAMGLLLAHAFGTMGIRRVLAITDAENLPAHKLLDALGFHRDAMRDVLFKGKQGKELDFACAAKDFRPSKQ